jgi:hypothetical protein
MFMGGQRTTEHQLNLQPNNSQRIVLLLILLAAWALRLHGLTKQDIWWDEARNIDVALRPLLQVAVAPELDIHPPLYFWLLHLWSRLHALSLGMEPQLLVYVTRLLSVVAGVLSVALLYPLAARIGNAKPLRWGGAVAACLGAFSPFWLAESQETRMYTVGFAWLLGAAVALLVAWQQRTRHALVAFVLLSVAALLTHYNAVFIVAAWYGGWLLWALWQPDRQEVLRAMVLCGVATALLVAPVAPIALRQIPVYANPNLIVPTLASYLAQNWQAYWGGYAFDPQLAGGWATVWLWGAGAILVVGLVVAAVTRLSKTALFFLFLWLAGGLALYYVAVLDRGAFNVRYASFVTPALYALMGVAVVALEQRWRVLGVGALVVGVAVWPQALYADLYAARFAREDIAGVTAWLRAHADANSVIFVDQKYPFGFYYDRYVIRADETPIGNEIAPARYLFVDINTIDAQLQGWAANASRVYWVQWFESDTDPRRAVPFLLDQVGARGGEENFQGYSVDWWQLEPPNEFVLTPNMQPLMVSFPPSVQSVAVSLPSGMVEQGSDVPVVIRWQRVAGGEVLRPLKTRVALYDAAGARVSQRDERLLNDRHLLPAEWSMSDQPLNVYLLEVADDLPTGHYTIRLLVYDADTLEPLGMVDGAGNLQGVEATIGSVEIVRGKP